METETYYEYAFGRLEDLKKRDIKNLTMLNSPLDFSIQSVLDEIETDSPLIIPKFFGVYQNIRPKIIGEEIENSEEIEKIFNMFKERGNKIYQDLFVAKIGRKDKYDSDLIHICYDYSLYNKEIMDNLLMENDRIRISPINECPNFKDKKSRFKYELTEKLKDIDLDIDEINSEMIRLAEKGYEELSSQLIKFGLTREEFIFLDSLYEIKNLGAKNKLDTGSWLYSLIKQYLNNENENFPN